MKSGHAPEIILFNKPFHVLSQFTSDGGKPSLKAYIQAPGFYPAGRLDYDSEGLLLLTNNGKLQAKISHPKHKMWKRYCVQVEGEIDQYAVDRLAQGLILKDGLTQPARAKMISPPQWLWPRKPPVRFRKTVPTSWLELEIREGRNRQVRRMCAATGFPVLRLIRLAVGPWHIQTLGQGEWKRIKLTHEQARI